MNYPRIMEATWSFLSSSTAGRARVLDALPEDERALFRDSLTWPGIDVELARRRMTLRRVLLEVFPVTYFMYVGQTGAEGVMRFLESTSFSTRPRQPGSAYPPAATTASAFVAFLESIGWEAEQQHFVREAYVFEKALLFPAPNDIVREAGAKRLRLVDGAWVAEASFDVSALGELLRQKGNDDPWHDAIYFAKPQACPFAIVSLPAPAGVRRIKLSGSIVGELRWLWDESAPVPPNALDRLALRRALASGIVTVEASS